uniref:Putative secreted peptide n=1 Tax=Anopheles braziliensis TaxID=58242 RepID=A0A2M3ZUL3_9DIPT
MVLMIVISISTMIIMVLAAVGWSPPGGMSGGDWRDIIQKSNYPLAFRQRTQGVRVSGEQITDCLLPHQPGVLPSGCSQNHNISPKRTS